MAATPPVCDFGRQAPAFRLPATDGQTYSLAELSGVQGTVIVFICNHCPFVLAMLDRLLRDARDLQALGIGIAAICSNDALAYPADSFDNMKLLAQQHDFPFPYLHDATQSVARAYDATCTPDFFGYDRSGGLQYRGRLDDARAQATSAAPRRDLYEAMRQIAETGAGPRYQIPSMGCSIKWRNR